MPDFYVFMMRHGEYGVQALIEMIERNEGIRHTAPLLLEDRWNVLMQKSPFHPSPVAA